MSLTLRAVRQSAVSVLAQCASPGAVSGDLRPMSEADGVRRDDGTFATNGRRGVDAGWLFGARPR